MFKQEIEKINDALSIIAELQTKAEKLEEERMITLRIMIIAVIMSAIALAVQIIVLVQ